MQELVNSIDWVAWLPWAVFGLTTSIVWLALDWWFRRGESWNVRLTAIRRAAREDRRRNVGADRESDRETDDAAMSVNVDTSGRTRESWFARTSRRLLQTLRNAVPSFLRTSAATHDGGLSRLERRLAMAGWRGETPARRFIALRAVAVLSGVVAAAYVFVAVSPVDGRTLAIAAGAFLACAATPDLALGAIARRRQRTLEREMPDALDLLVVCVEAGQGLDQALRRIAELLARSHAVVSDELDVCVRQLQIGRSRAQVLRDLGERNASDSLRGLAAMLVQADRFGVSIGAALRSQSESLRTRRRQRAEEQAAGISVKLVFPLVLFTFPALLAVLVGPAALHLVRDLFPLLGGR